MFSVKLLGFVYLKKIVLLPDLSEKRRKRNSIIDDEILNGFIFFKFLTSFNQHRRVINNK